MKKTVKRALAGVLTSAVMLSGVALADAPAPTTVELDGEVLTTDAYIDTQNRTQIPLEAARRAGVTGEFAEEYLPLRSTFEAQGFTVEWDAEARKVVVTSPASVFEKLPTLVYSELEALMKRQSDKYVRADNVVPMLWQGLLEMPVAEGRTAKLYVPENTPQGAMFVVMNAPAGEDAYAFMKNSGWMDKADAEEFCLFVLEPANGGWGSADAEADYVKAAVGAARAGKWLQPGPSIYLVGYGEIGSLLQKYAMENPIAVAGAVFFDASQIDADYLAKNGDVSFDTATKTYGVTRKEVPVPVCIAEAEPDAASEAVAAYWTDAAKDENAVARFAPEGESVLANAVQSVTGTFDYASAETTDAAWGFLDQYYRYGGGVLSNAISKKIDYKAMGVEFRSFTDSQGIARQYLVYIPAACRGAGKKLPVVVAYHGASTSMRNFFENTLWYNIADREGIMLVFPESSLIPVPGTLGGGEANPTAYRALWTIEDPSLKLTDYVYGGDLLDEIEKEYADYVDTSRLFCTGHSMGCMMTHYLGSTDVSHRYAAMGATSGPLMAREDTGSQIVPMFHTMAQYDMWSYDLSQDSSMTINAVNMWLIRDGLADEASVEQVRKDGFAASVTDGRWNTSSWKNDQGVELFRYTWVTGKDHVNMPAENELLWNEWFSHWSLGENGVRAFDGQSIGG